MRLKVVKWSMQYQPSMKIRNFIILFKTACELDSVLYLLKIHFNITLSSTPSYSKWLFP
jgi:hypothetical protein